MDWLTYIFIDETWDIAKILANAQALVAKFPLTYLDKTTIISCFGTCGTHHEGT
mgnify:CR=1 FL=1